MFNNNRLPKFFEYRLNCNDPGADSGMPSGMSSNEGIGDGAGGGGIGGAISGFDPDAEIGQFLSQFNGINDQGVMSQVDSNMNPTGVEGYVDSNGNFVTTGSNNVVTRFFTKLQNYWSDSNILGNLFGNSFGKIVGAMMAMTMPQVVAAISVIRAGYTVGMTALSYADGVELGLTKSDVDAVNTFLSDAGSTFGDNAEAWSEFATGLEKSTEDYTTGQTVLDQALAGIRTGDLADSRQPTEDGSLPNMNDVGYDGDIYLLTGEDEYLRTALGTDAEKIDNFSDLLDLAIEKGVPLPTSLIERGLNMNPEATYYIDPYGNVSDSATGEAVLGAGKDGEVLSGTYTDNNQIWNAGYNEAGEPVVGGEYDFNEAGELVNTNETVENAGGNLLSSIPDLFIPENIPDELSQGFQNYSDQTRLATDAYTTKWGDLWGDYLEFEELFFNKYEDVQNQYNTNIASMPSASMTLPSAMGGGNFDLAPVQHANMYNNIAATQSNLIGNQAATQFASMGTRNDMNNKLYGVNMGQAAIDFMPTETGLDLYKMQLASDLGLEQVEANQPSTWSTWAPVVGSLLSTNSSGETGLESVVDFVGDLFG